MTGDVLAPGLSRAGRSGAIRFTIAVASGARTYREAGEMMGCSVSMAFRWGSLAKHAGLVSAVKGRNGTLRPLVEIVPMK